jgi:hypothetical protein
MSVYARSDLAAVTVSEAHGGCGKTHHRPASDGNPALLWELDCADCCNHLRSDPLWSSTRAELPETYDEKIARERDEKTGRLDRDKQIVDALIKLGDLGGLPAALAEALASHGIVPAALAGQVVCGNGHDNQPGNRFCAACGVSMSQPVPKAAIGAAESHPEPPGDEATPVQDSRPRRLVDARLDELQALAREKGLDADGTRRELIGRLKAAGVRNSDLQRSPLAA